LRVSNDIECPGSDNRNAHFFGAVKDIIYHGFRLDRDVVVVGATKIEVLSVQLKLLTLTLHKLRVALEEDKHGQTR
jgi:hypothetical protein